MPPASPAPDAAPAAGPPPEAESPVAPDPARELAALRHDLLTPLNQIIGYSELLEEEATEEHPAAVADLRRIQQAAATLVDLIRTRLQLAPLPAPGAAPPARPIPAAGGLPLPAVGASPVQATEPAAASAPAVAPAPASNAPDPQPQAPGPAPRHGRILAVDDDPLNRDMLASRLVRQGHSVTTAADGVEVLEKVRQQRFDLVLLDVMMPRLDGYDTLLQLKADEELRHLPVIMISALDDLSSVVRCIEAGAEDYLPKPFNATLLRARIGACLEKKALRDQELELYQNLMLSQQRLDRELSQADRFVASMAADVREDPRVAPLLAAFQRMAGAVSRRETELRATIKELEIKINTAAVQGQVGSILGDPSFSSLAERARAMRQRRAAS